MDSPQLQFIVVVDISVIAQWQIPMVIEILQLQYIDMVVDVGCAGPAFSPGFVVQETAELPQLQHGPCRSHARCVQRQMPWSMFSRSSSNVVDVAVMPQRPVPVVGLNSWNDG